MSNGVVKSSHRWDILFQAALIGNLTDAREELLARVRSSWQHPLGDWLHR